MYRPPVVEIGQLVKISREIHGVSQGEYGVVVREFLDGSVLVLISDKNEVVRHYRADLEVTGVNSLAR